MARSFVLAAALVGLSLGGCGGRKERCEKLAEHLESVADKEGATSSRAADYQSCMDGMSDEQIDCTMKATSRDAIVACAK
jgi:hypothetical protein